jgi:hypothetical protein
MSFFCSSTLVFVNLVTFLPSRPVIPWNTVRRACGLVEGSSGRDGTYGWKNSVWLCPPRALYGETLRLLSVMSPAPNRFSGAACRYVPTTCLETRQSVELRMGALRRYDVFLANDSPPLQSSFQKRLSPLCLRTSQL